MLISTINLSNDLNILLNKAFADVEVEKDRPVGGL